MPIPALNELHQLNEYFIEPMDEEKNTENKLKSMNYFEVLQLDKDFFQNFNPAEFDKHFKNLKIKYHPDRNAHSKESTLVFQLIQDAGECMRNENCREKYLMSHSDDDNYKKSIIEKNIKSTLADLRLMSRESIDSIKSLFPDQAFAMSIGKLSKWQWEDSSNEQKKSIREIFKIWNTVFNKLYKVSKTGDDFYRIGLIQEHQSLNNKYFISKALDCFQKAAKLKHIISMGKIASAAVVGLLTPHIEAVPWAIKCIYYLENSILKELSLHEDKDEQIHKFTMELHSIITKTRRNIRGLSQNSPIPELNTQEFNDLLQETISGFRDKNLWREGRCDFQLTDETFEKIQETHLYEQIYSAFPLEKDKELLTISDQIKLETDKEPPILQPILLAIDQFDQYIINMYSKNTKILNQNKTFYEAARTICRTIYTENPHYNQKEFNEHACKKISKIAAQTFKHRDFYKRLLADIIFIPLGIATAGILFAAKYGVTGSPTFLTHKTNRQQELEKYLTDSKTTSSKNNSTPSK